eukprot:TRINITY_DN5275_c2_g1_i1.p1 TRINITY_DN5275_c2_g1~~TRINITY_DN5275_c2_g1_i1.p1  ORF type:complete len:150 (+),score=17.14 TRINITY_DN5275_c2_g1_i1:23-451(+)
MCEVWSWHWYMIDTEPEDQNVYQYSESEVDEILGGSRSSLGDSDGGGGEPSETGVLFSRGRVAPCLHNSWDNVRAKKTSVTLRCRECSAKWKTSNSLIVRCKSFTLGHCNFSHCSRVHVHKFKHSVEKRKNEQRSSETPHRS